jgi:hypothetical protein
MHHRNSIWLLVAVVCMLLLPAAAIAGRRVFAGPQSLQLKVTASPSKAAGQHLTLGMHIDYESTNGQRIMNDTKQILIAPPRGLTLNVLAAEQCSYNAFANAKGNVSACQKASIVGSGSAVIDARPSVTTLLTFPITVYNMTRGPRGSHNALLLYVHKGRVREYIFFNIFSNDGRQTLAYSVSRPAPGVGLLFTLRTVNLKVHDSSNGESFISAPPTCNGVWRFAVRIASYPLNGVKLPAIQATDNVACRP